VYLLFAFALILIGVVMRWAGTRQTEVRR
jgi:hypothetical protein